MQPKVCQCCGKVMASIGLSNPNVCLNCDQWSSTWRVLGFEERVGHEKIANHPAADRSWRLQYIMNSE